PTESDPPSLHDALPILPLAERIFMPRNWPGSVMGFLEWKVPTCTCAKQNFTSFISLAACGRYHWSSAAEPGPGLAIRNGSSPAADRKSTRLNSSHVKSS